MRNPCPTVSLWFGRGMEQCPRMDVDAVTAVDVHVHLEPVVRRTPLVASL